MEKEAAKKWRSRMSSLEDFEEYRRTFKYYQGVIQGDNVNLELYSPGNKVVLAAGQSTSWREDSRGGAAVWPFGSWSSCLPYTCRSHLPQRRPHGTHFRLSRWSRNLFFMGFCNVRSAMAPFALDIVIQGPKSWCIFPPGG